MYAMTCIFLSRLCGGEEVGNDNDVQFVFLSRLCGGEVVDN